MKRYIRISQEWGENTLFIVAVTQDAIARLVNISREVGMHAEPVPTQLAKAWQAKGVYKVVSFGEAENVLRQGSF